MGAASQGPLQPQLTGFAKSVIRIANGASSTPVSAM